MGVFFAGRLSYLPILSLSIGTLKTSIPRSGAKGVCSSDSMTILRGRSRASCEGYQRTLMHSSSRCFNLGGSTGAET